MVASFDIDRGPIMEHQYPGAISGDENMLAELMLPDQAHVRAQDWTLFFLHKDAEVEEESDNEKDPRDEQGQQGGADEHERHGEHAENGETPEGGEGPPLIYVLNLVNMKHDSSVKRFVLVWLGRQQLANISVKRCCCQSNGDLYETPIPPHLQSECRRNHTRLLHG